MIDNQVCSLSANYAVFTHLTAKKAPLYRAVPDFFGAARERFITALRPGDVTAALAERGRHGSMILPVAIPDCDELNVVLEQLVVWGTRSATRDTTEVATVEALRSATPTHSIPGRPPPPSPYALRHD